MREGFDQAAWRRRPPAGSRHPYLLAVGLASLLVGPSFATQRAAPFDPATVVAEVGDRELTLGELLFRFASLPSWSRERYGDELDRFLRDVVANMLLAGQAEQQGLAEDPLFQRLIELRREEVLLDLYGRRTLLGDLDAAARERWNEQREVRFTRPAAIRLWHLLATPVDETPDANREGVDADDLAAARAKIDAIAARLAAGEDPEDLARRFSEDATAAAGGDLGWRSLDQLIPELADASTKLAIGAPPRIVESPLGVHLVAVLDRRTAGEVPFEAVAELLRQEIAGERLPAVGDSARAQRERLVEQAGSTLHPERLPW